MRCMAFWCCLLVAASPAVSHGSEPNNELDALRKDIAEIKNLLLTLSARVEALENRLSSITANQSVLKVEVEAGRNSGPYLRFPIEIERAMMGDAWGPIHRMPEHQWIDRDPNWEAPRVEPLPRK